MKRKFTCSCLFAALLVAVTIGAFFVQSLRDWAAYSPGEQSAQRTLQQTELVLEAVATYAGQPMPEDLPVYDVAVVRCWETLQQIMAANDYRYSIDPPIVLGDYGTPIPSGTGTTEVIINIVFADSQRMQMQFYADTLVLCQKMDE